MDATLAGYPWLPRMIDIARVARAGTLGDYYRYPCPIDRACLDALGIDADRFAAIAERAPDQAMVEELVRLGVPAPDTLSFDPLAILRELDRDRGS